MNAFLLRTAVALLLPAAILAARHSKIVALAIGWPLAANLYVSLSGVELAIEHPARVLVPAISSALGFAELYAEARDGHRFSQPAILGLLVFASGAADIAALPAFAVLNEWAVPYIQIVVCTALIIVSLWPRRRLPWISSLVV
ncbi:MAG: hypothetical protein IPM54_25110 [Polyangiaceae bacterium]|nr:hypothetical protein [Polyangiaceae bacterium]